MHASKNGRGRGWWEEGHIVVGLIHHCDWRCLRARAVGFILGSTTGVVGVDKNA